MQIINTHSSPNHDPRPINVEYVVLHYTACDAKTTIGLFTDPERQASSHLVVDTNGDIYEMVKCLNGEAFRAWHAGKSTFFDGTKNLEGFNDFSIGIEIVNFNGNIFEYSDSQYSALKEIFTKLKVHYPKLLEAKNVVGHEDIAGFRGKCDPGIKFDWKRFFSECYPGDKAPERSASISSEIQNELILKAANAPSENDLKNNFFMNMSLELEALMKKP